MSDNVVLAIELTLLRTEDGGRTRPLDPSWLQYRPNWGFHGLAHPREQNGAPVACWRDGPMAPGASTFDSIVPVFPDAWTDVMPGDVLYMYEGYRLCAVAVVHHRGAIAGDLRTLAIDDLLSWCGWVHLGIDPASWHGVEGIPAPYGELTLPATKANASLHPVVLPYEEQKALEVAYPCAAELVVDGAVVHRAYGAGPDPLLAAFAGEQRWLVEEVGAPAEVGATYVEKARRRVAQLRPGSLAPVAFGRLGLPEPWEDLATGAPDAEERRLLLRNELRAEIRSGHDLYGQDLNVVAACGGHCDDVVVRTPDAWWRVHLTYSKSERPPWPMAGRFDSTLALAMSLVTDDHSVADFVD